jgi:hypothetical protein
VKVFPTLLLLLSVLLGCSEKPDSDVAASLKSNRLESDLEARLTNAGIELKELADIQLRSKNGDAGSTYSLLEISGRRNPDVAADDLFDDRVYYWLLLAKQQKKPFGWELAAFEMEDAGRAVSQKHCAQLLAGLNDWAANELEYKREPKETYEIVTLEDARDFYTRLCSKPSWSPVN